MKIDSKNKGILDSLPATKKSGWPWDEETNPAIYTKKDKWPRLSIVTPSFNQGEFIEETIRSVLLQNYPNLEYIIIDGGSTDNTIEVIKEYEKWITYWISEADNGQSHAINKGFKHCEGSIIGWLNSDDFYSKDAFRIVLDNINPSEPQLVFGNSTLFDNSSKEKWHSDVVNDHKKFSLKLIDYIIQPSSFFTRDALDITGLLSEELHYVFDWDFFLRLFRNKIIFTPIPQFLSLYRKHPDHKSSKVASKNERQFEIEQMVAQNNNLKTKLLLKKLRGKTAILKQIRYYLNKAKLEFLYFFVATLIYPRIFLFHKRNKIESIIRMI